MSDVPRHPCPSCGAPMYLETTDPSSLDYCADSPRSYLLCPDCGDAIGDYPQKGPQQLISEGKDRLAGLRARMDQERARRDRS